MDYYSLLGVESNATKAEIKKNYRLLATKFHPDKNKDPKAASKFIAISEAYDVLNNKKSRALYDLKKWDEQKKASQSDYDFTVVVPPTESIRSRRNKAQQKRALKYHNSASNLKGILLLLQEGLYIASRYTFHLLGASILLFVMYAATAQITSIFETAIGGGIIVSLFLLLLLYGVFKIAQSFIEEYRIDVKTFSVFYNIPTLQAVILSVYVPFIIAMIFVAKTLF